MGSARGDKAPTGVAGLDQVLGGGLPRDRLYLVQGDPGVGKTTLALQFLLAGLKAGEPCLYITLSETSEELRAAAKSHGWSLDGLPMFELSAAEELTTEQGNTLFHPAEVELVETTRLLLAEIERVKPARLVIDSLSEIRLMSQSALRYRRQVLALKQFFVGRRMTVLLLDDRTSEPGDLQLQSVAHGVLTLEHLSPLYGAERRRLRVLKLRGLRFRGGYHDFVIQPGGMKLFPRLVPSEGRVAPPRARFSSGVAELDELTGGGLDGGTSTLFMGAAGTGKSTVAMQYVAAAARDGVRSAIFAFDESADTLMQRADAVGFGFRELVETGMIEIRQVDPAELAPGEFAHTVKEAAELRNVRLIVLDSLNGYMHAMPQEHFLTLLLHEMLTQLGQLGVATLMVVAQHGVVGHEIEAPIDVSYLADSVLLFRHFEIDGRLAKSVCMFKRRSGRHETTIRELTVSSRGISLSEPLQGLHGVLTGIPMRAIAKGGA